MSIIILQDGHQDGHKPAQTVLLAVQAKNKVFQGSFFASGVASAVSNGLVVIVGKYCGRVVYHIVL